MNKLSDELADSLTLLWLQKQDLSNLKEPQEIVELFHEIREKIKPTSAQNQQTISNRKSSGRKIISPGI